MIVHSTKEIIQYHVFFHPHEHPEIFEAPKYKRKSMCLKILEDAYKGSSYELNDPIVKAECFCEKKIELVVYSYQG